MRNARETRRILLACMVMFLFEASLAAQTDSVVRVIQTNSAGTNAHLIDPATVRLRPRQFQLVGVDESAFE